MLTMTLSANTMKIVTFHNPLKAFALGRSNNIHDFAFSEYVNSK